MSLVYVEEASSRSSASSREHEIKTMKRTEKEALRNAECFRDAQENTGRG